MSLSTYKKKRSFKETPEPQGGQSDKETLHFVVQKHDATRLHYDFRLEMGGVLKSWAVPKGPSTDPSVKRLAVMVEDHPYDYKDFEGIIPKGQYGGGTVIVWDEGTYTPMAEAKDKKEMEKLLLKELKEGKVVVNLNGSKLKGEYALVKSHTGEENQWLLMKAKDQHAKTSDITNKDKSVHSGKTIKQMEKEPDNVYGKSTGKKALKKEIAKSLDKGDDKSAAAETKDADAKQGKKEKFPSTLSPMLATLVDKPFDTEGWQYEVKWDGYRAVAFVNRNKVELRSRNDKSFNEKFYPVHKALQELNLHAVLDGEIAVVTEAGTSNFGNLQNWRSEADGELKYYVFDILWLNGYSLTELPLHQRRELLEATLPENDIILPSKSFDVKGTEFFEVAKQLGLEGIIAKKTDSLYAPGLRSKEWLKIKVSKRHEVVIGGFTKNEGTAKQFSSLLVGVYDNDMLVYTGKIGTGFNEEAQQQMMKQFKPLITDKNPFSVTPDVNKPSRFRPNPPRAKATWLKPQLVCEVSYTEITSDGVMRHPSFECMREDKKPKDVHAENASPTKKIVPMKNATVKAEQVIEKPKGNIERKTLLNPTDKTQVRKINGHELSFSNLDKVYWPKEKYTKRDMLNYYYQVAPFILPYMKDRPQSLNRHPNGINGPSFYQKDVTGKSPDWVEKFPYHSEADNEDKNFMVCTNEAGLLWIASLGCIEMNPWSSRVKKPDNPDWCLIDLDPDKNHYDQVIEGALAVKQVLDAIGVEGYPKTSGSTGMHIYIPLGAKYTYEESKEFARAIVTVVQQQLPDFTSIERATKSRKGKMYLDFLQNRSQATLAAPYSVRPKPGATVSAPLHWDEVKKGLKLSDFTMINMMDRIKEVGDLFKPVLGKGINMQKALKALENL